MEKFIALPDGSTAFITGCKDDSGCEHQWDGEGLITFGNGETFKETEYRKILDTLTVPCEPLANTSFLKIDCFIFYRF